MQVRARIFLGIDVFAKSLVDGCGKVDQGYQGSNQRSRQHPKRPKRTEQMKAAIEKLKLEVAPETVSGRQAVQVNNMIRLVYQAVCYILFVSAVDRGVLRQNCPTF